MGPIFNYLSNQKLTKLPSLDSIEFPYYTIPILWKGFSRYKTDELGAGSGGCFIDKFLFLWYSAGGSVSRNLYDLINE